MKHPIFKDIFCDYFVTISTKGNLAKMLSAVEGHAEFLYFVSISIDISERQICLNYNLS